MEQDSGDRRALLTQQLDIAWQFAEGYVIDRITDAVMFWEPSDNVCTVRRTTEGWMADWPDEEHPPLPDTTVAWLLWHIEWWWANAANVAHGRPRTEPGGHAWSGDTGGIAAAKSMWDDILLTADLDRPVTGFMDEPVPLWFVAGWVNFELTKNLAEINHLKLLHANATGIVDPTARAPAGSGGGPGA